MQHPYPRLASPHTHTPGTGSCCREISAGVVILVIPLNPNHPSGTVVCWWPGEQAGAIPLRELTRNMEKVYLREPAVTEQEGGASR